jgi:hypothetical protein
MYKALIREGVDQADQQDVLKAIEARTQQLREEQRQMPNIPKNQVPHYWQYTPNKVPTDASHEPETSSEPPLEPKKKSASASVTQPESVTE